MENIENQEQRSNRDRTLERLKTRYPDKKFEDDEEIYGQISDDYDAYDKELGGYKEREKTFSDMFTADPRSAHFLQNWKNGEDPVVGLIRQFGTDIKDAIDDPERQEQIAAANKEFVERVAKEKELEETYQKNLDGSLKELEAWQQEKGLSDDEIDKVMEYLVGIVRDGIMGKFTTESYDMAQKALNHDTDVVEANQEGEVRGRNTRIEERLRKREKGDGTASLDGKNGGSGRGGNGPSLGAIERYDDGYDTIWERGGEKRNKAAL